MPLGVSQNLLQLYAKFFKIAKAIAFRWFTEC